MGQVEYPDEYIEQVFYLWYDGGRKQGNEFVNSLPEAPDGRKPSKFTIIKWADTRGWVERADALDAQVSVSLDSIMLEKRKAMFEERIRVADELLNMGLEFLREAGKGIKTDATAVRAIELALTTKRDSVGAVEAYAKISKMSDDEIQKELTKLLGSKSDDDIIDGDFDTVSK